MLIDKDMKKKDLAIKAGTSTYTMNRSIRPGARLQELRYDFML